MGHGLLCRGNGDGNQQHAFDLSAGQAQQTSGTHPASRRQHRASATACRTLCPREADRQRPCQRFGTVTAWLATRCIGLTQTAGSCARSGSRSEPLVVARVPRRFALRGVSLRTGSFALPEGAFLIIVRLSVWPWSAQCPLPNPSHAAARALAPDASPAPAPMASPPSRSDCRSVRSPQSARGLRPDPLRCPSATH